MSKLNIDLINSLLAENGQNYKDLAAYCGISESAAGKYCRGVTFPNSQRVFNKICKFFGVTKEQALIKKDPLTFKVLKQNYEKQLEILYRSKDKTLKSREYAMLKAIVKTLNGSYEQ